MYKECLFGECYIVLTEKQLSTFLQNIYKTHYGSERFLHLSEKNKRIPMIKRTADIVSFPLYALSPSEEEICLSFDGKVNDERILLTNITITEPNDAEFDERTYRFICSILKKLTQVALADSFIYIAYGSQAYRISHGRLFSSQHLIQELYDQIPMVEKEKFKALHDWLQCCETHRKQED